MEQLHPYRLGGISHPTAHALCLSWVIPLVIKISLPWEETMPNTNYALAGKHPWKSYFCGAIPGKCVRPTPLHLTLCLWKNKNYVYYLLLGHLLTLSFRKLSYILEISLTLLPRNYEVASLLVRFLSNTLW